MDAKAPKGNRYDKAFVAQALELLKCRGRPRSHIAKELGVSQTSMERWEMQANLSQGGPVPPYQSGERHLPGFLITTYDDLHQEATWPRNSLWLRW